LRGEITLRGKVTRGTPERGSQGGFFCLIHRRKAEARKIPKEKKDTQNGEEGSKRRKLFSFSGDDAEGALFRGRLLPRGSALTSLLKNVEKKKEK